MNPGTRLTFEWQDAQIEDWNSRPPTVSDVVDWLESEGVGEALVLAEDELGVIEKTQLAGACYDEGPYWNLPAGSYLVARIEGET